MSWQFAQHASTEEHFLYFALGFAAGNIVWLALMLGIFVGYWRWRDKRTKL